MLRNLQQIIEQLPYLRFEGVLVAGALIILATGLFTSRTSIFRLIVASTLVVALLFPDLDIQPATILFESLETNGIINLMKLLFGVVTVWVVFFPSRHQSEYYFILLSLLLGCCILMAANHLLILYLGLELTSFCGYLLTNFQFRKQSFEAGIKYLIFGGVSSAVLLYGISLVYGITGTMVLSEMSVGSMLSDQPLFGFGMICLLGGILFKVTIFPFHIWVPSTYQEAPTDAVAVLSSLPKIAGLLLLHRVLVSVEFSEIFWLTPLLAILGMLTIAIGTLGAIRQTNAKRLLAYGAIAHSGFFLATVLVPGTSGLMSFVYYSVIYSVMNLASFYLVSVHEHQGVIQTRDYSGLGRAAGYMGGLFVVAMISLVGLPPTAGFTAKFYLFSALWERYQDLADPIFLTYLLVAVASTVVSLFFYLRIPYQYFIVLRNNIKDVAFSIDTKVVATILAFALLWLFFSPEFLNKIVFNIKLIGW